mmetsp:Transcript_5141/g.22947  ORF Transcript_5141/g.22947 Transcript_5141/m.22947 type:complete len:466 (-) Transcript_5141:1220-2617(-)
MCFIRLIRATTKNAMESKLPVHALPARPALVLPLPLLMLIPPAAEAAPAREPAVKVAKVRVLPLLLPRVVFVGFLGRDAPEAFVHVVPRLGHLVHLPRRPQLSALGGLIRVPLQRRLLVRLFNEIAPAVLRELGEVLRQVEHLGVVPVVIVLVLRALRLVQPTPRLLQDPRSLARTPLRVWRDAFDGVPQVADGALGIVVPQMNLGSRNHHPGVHPGVGPVARTLELLLAVVRPVVVAADGLRRSGAVLQRRFERSHLRVRHAPPGVNLGEHRRLFIRAHRAQVRGRLIRGLEREPGLAAVQLVPGVRHQLAGVLDELVRVFEERIIRIRAHRDGEVSNRRVAVAASDGAPGAVRDRERANLPAAPVPAGDGRGDGGVRGAFALAPVSQLETRSSRRELSSSVGFATGDSQRGVTRGGCGDDRLPVLRLDRRAHRGVRVRRDERLGEVVEEGAIVHLTPREDKRS